MAFNPFDSGSSDIFGNRRFSDSTSRNTRDLAEIGQNAISNKFFVEAQRRAAEYQERAAKANRPSTGSQIGGAIASAAVSAGVALI